ncbi:MAG: hypothetical protein ACLR8P_12640 [Clostridium fessum]
MCRKSLAKKMTIVPVRISKDQLYLAMADPLNFMAIEEAQHTSKRKVVPMIASEPAVKACDQYFVWQRGSGRSDGADAGRDGSGTRGASGADGGKRRTGKCDADDPPGQFDY